MKLVTINDFGNRIWKKGKINLKAGSSYEDYMRQSQKNNFLIFDKKSDEINYYKTAVERRKKFKGVFTTETPPFYDGSIWQSTSTRLPDGGVFSILSNITDLKRREASLKQLSDSIEVTPDDIAEVVSMWTKIHVTRLGTEEKQRLLDMEGSLTSKVSGQKDAIHSISMAVRRARSGIKDPSRPIGCFLFLGPTGVGKTHLVKKLSEFMYGEEDKMIRLDMSEYMERHTVARLIGSPPGYVGFEDGGQLTEAVRRNSYTTILLDEIEKAHPDVFNILLQIFEDGFLTDSKGRRVDFKNTLIVMTSNLGSDLIKDDSSLGFSSSSPDSLNDDNYLKMKTKVLYEVKRFF